MVDADLGFHHALARAVGSPRLERLYLSMSGEIRLCIAQLRPAWTSPTAMAEEHRELLAVIESGDVEAAEARMTAHLERAVRDLTTQTADAAVGEPRRLAVPGGVQDRSSASASSGRGLLSISRLMPDRRLGHAAHDPRAHADLGQRGRQADLQARARARASTGSRVDLHRAGELGHLVRRARAG